MHARTTEPIPANLLLHAYRSGVFPMADHRDDPDVFWVEPRERAIIPLDEFRCSKSLAKVLRQDRFEVTCDRAFVKTIAACAEPREELAESWISKRIEASYVALHLVGQAHSIECWEDGTLVGGLYGVAFDRVFCGESMFSRRSNASKVALAWLVAVMRKANYAVLDCQFMTDHLASMGAVSMPQENYLELLAQARGQPDMSLPDAFASFAQASSAGSAAGSASSAGSASPGKSIAQSLTQTS